MNEQRTLIASILLAVMTISGLTALPAAPAYSQASQWTWNSPNHTNCDGFTISNIKHSTNTIANIMSMPVIKAFYPEGTVLVDHPGLTGCAAQTGVASYTNHFPHTHTSASSPPYTYIHAIWFLGGCDDFVLVDGCYKYEQFNYFYNSATGVDPKFKHQYKVYGPGFSFTLGYPQYSAFFKVDTDILGSGGDSFQRKTGTSTWSTVSTESNFLAFDYSGAMFRVYDSSSTTKYLEISVPSIDNLPRAWVLQYVAGEDDPTGNSLANKMNEPTIWDGTGSVNGANIVYWYKTFTGSSSSSCQPTAPCTIGPTIYLRGGL